MKNRIEELYCFAVVDDDDIEGVPAINRGGFMMPLMGADLERALSMVDFADRIQKESGKKVRLYKFTNKEELVWDHNEN